MYCIFYHAVVPVQIVQLLAHTVIFSITYTKLQFGSKHLVTPVRVLPGYSLLSLFTTL